MAANCAIAAVYLLLLTRFIKSVFLFDPYTLASADRKESTASTNKNVCETPACHQLAQLLLKQMNQSADPCEDFYQHACGGFVGAHPLLTEEDMRRAADEVWDEDPPIGRDSLRMFIAQEIIRNTTRAGLEAIGENDANTPNSLKFAKRYYDSCLAWDRTSEGNQNEVTQFIKDFAIWPFFNDGDWLDVDIDLVDVVARLHGSLGISAIVSLQIHQNKFDRTQHSLYLKPPWSEKWFDGSCFNTSSEHSQLRPLCNDSAAKYRRLIAGTFKTLAINAGLTVKGGIAGLQQIAQKIVDFETDLLQHRVAEPPPWEPQRRESLEEIKRKYQRYSLKQLNTLHNNTRLWRRFFRAAFRNESEGMDWFRNKSNQVIVAQIDYFKFLEEKYATTPKYIIANYLLWKLVANLGSLVGEKQNDLLGGYQNERHREALSQGELPREKQNNGISGCLREVDTYFRDVTTRMYIERRFKKSKQDSITEMTREIVSASREIFEENKWLSDIAKPRFLSKLDNLVLNIGYPEWVLNTTELDRRYGKWKSIETNKSYFANTIRFKRWNYKQLLVPASRFDFGDEEYPTSTGNAHYAPSDNALTIPAGTFEYPFYDEAYPEAFKYGLTGNIAGHELFHAFDNFGVNYDAFGNGTASELGGPILLEGCTETFANLSQCLVNEFDAYCYDIWLPEPSKPKFDINNFDLENTQNGVLTTTTTRKTTTTTAPPSPYHNCVNGIWTLSENLADFNGVRAAYRAYRNAQKKSANPETDLRLPGLEQYSVDQLFFLSFSVFWCQAYNPLALAWELDYISQGRDPHSHSPADARVNELAKQFPAFAEAFKCQNGSRLKPDIVCTVY